LEEREANDENDVQVGKQEEEGEGETRKSSLESSLLILKGIGVQSVDHLV